MTRKEAFIEHYEQTNEVKKTLETLKVFLCESNFVNEEFQKYINWLNGSNKETELPNLDDMYMFFQR